MEPVPIHSKLISYFNRFVALLEENLRACVILPTGCGKSHFVLRYLHLHPPSCVLFITSQTAISRDFDEKLEKFEISIPIIHFCLYQSLSYRFNHEEIGNAYDMIILDEYRHAGASAAEEVIQSIICLNPDARILGMDATPIRFLDINGPRNMTDPLFQNRVAAEIDLYQAICESILIKPNYVSCVFSFTDTFPKYLDISENEEYRLSVYQQFLKKARRSLHLAKGMDQLFKEFLCYPHGKYIVFCSSIVHLKKMMTVAKNTWFQKWEPSPSLYYDYADSPPHENHYNAFKEDNDHRLRLLFCVDMLSEGVHPLVDGVILLRPTASPNVFYQQIGRCMSICRRTNLPQIIDIVGNLDGIHKTVSSMNFSDQFQASESSDVKNQDKSQMQSLSDQGSVNDPSVSPDKDKTQESFNDHETMNDRDHTENAGSESHSVGQCIIHSDRKSGSEKKAIDPDNESGSELNSLEIGPFTVHYIDVDMTEVLLKIKESLPHHPESWNIGLNIARHYFKSYGNLDILPGEEYLGFPLGDWVDKARSRRWSKGPHHLHERQIQELDELHIDWYFESGWEIMYKLSREFYDQYHHLTPTRPIPPKYKALPAWLSRQRGKRKGVILPPLSERQIALLDSIGMVWDMRHRLDVWNEMYCSAKELLKQYPDLDFPVTEETQKIYDWPRLQMDYLKGKRHSPLNKEQTKLLLDLNVLDKKSRFWRCLENVKQFLNEYGELPKSKGTRSNESRLYQWIRNQCRSSNLQKMSADKKQALLDIGILH